MRHLICAIVLVTLLLPLRSAGAGKEDPFTVVLLPDTQFYSEQFPQYFYDQTKWIADNLQKENVVFVSHVGDIVQWGDKNPNEWEVANRAMSQLDGVTPWAVAIGNHDYDLGEPHGRATAFLKHFGPQRFRDKPWFGGASENGLNTYQFFEGGGRRFIIFHLECDIPDQAIEWAKSVLAKYPGVPAIVTTHIYLYDHGPGRTAEKYYRRDIGNSGREVWQKFIRSNPQVFMVLCGHWGEEGGEWHQVSKNDAEQDVFEILADYQFWRNGGNGWLLTIRFDPAGNLIRVRSYTPSRKRYGTDSNSDFTFAVDFEERFKASK